MRNWRPSLKNLGFSSPDSVVPVSLDSQSFLLISALLGLLLSRIVGAIV